MMKPVSHIIKCVPLILLLLIISTAAVAEESKKIFSGDKGFDLDAGLGLIPFREDLSLKYSFTDNFEAGLVAGIGPYLWMPTKDKSYEDTVITTALIMARAGIFIQLPITPLEFLTFTPCLEGLIKCEANYAKVESSLYDFSGDKYGLPWVIEVDLTLELALSTGKLLKVKFLEPLSITAGLFTPVADAAIMYDRFAYWIGLGWRFF